MSVVARIVAFLLAASLPIEESSAKTRAGHAGSATIENSEWVDVDPQAAWKAFVEDVDKWWPADLTRGGDASTLTMEPTAGGCVQAGDGERQMTIVFVVPGKLMCTGTDLLPLQGLAAPGALEWGFSEENGGTRITLRYRADEADAEDIALVAQLVSEMQAMQLAGLARYLGHLAGDPGETQA